jgi:transcriptional regulator with XRE-family HTH domain
VRAASRRITNLRSAALPTTDDPAELSSEELAAEGPAGLNLRQLGERLRDARTGKRWTRSDVERLSGGRWTAAAVGSYERAERMLTAVNLFLLAEFYRVPIEDLIGCDAPQARPIQVRRIIIIDTRLLSASLQWPWLMQFTSSVQQARAGHSRRFLRLRSRDIPRLAAIHREAVDRLLSDLDAAKVLIVERPASDRPTRERPARDRPASDRRASSRPTS